MNRVETLKNHPASYVRNYMGSFYGILRWPQLDELWRWLGEHGDNWYLYATDEEAPTSPQSANELATQIQVIDAYLHQTHNADYCGVVYVDQLQEPQYIKVYNPKGMGSSCSMSEIPPLPKWIISREKPVDLHPLLHAEEVKRHWWKVWK